MMMMLMLMLMLMQLLCRLRMGVWGRGWGLQRAKAVYAPVYARS